jgi:two-component sensor histidine kinase
MIPYDSCLNGWNLDSANEARYLLPAPGLRVNDECADGVYTLDELLAVTAPRGIWFGFVPAAGQDTWWPGGAPTDVAPVAVPVGPGRIVVFVAGAAAGTEARWARCAVGPLAAAWLAGPAEHARWAERATVAHDLASPIGILRSATTLIQERLAALEAHVREPAMTRRSLLAAVQALEEPLALATSQSARAATMLARIRASVREPVYSLAALVQANVNSVRPSIPNLDVVVEGDANLGMIDTAAMGQVLQNLLENAALHAYWGRSGKVRVAISSDAGGATLEVRDDGRGVPAELRETLFAAGVTGGSGSGLGLFSARRAARDRLGGDLLLVSGEAPGACFRLTLPPQRTVG